MTYVHLFTGRACEAPGCSHLSVSLYPTRGGRGLVRACNPLHAREAQEPRYCEECGELTYGRCPCEYRHYVSGEEEPIGDAEGDER